jgi:hypothetical protein
MGSEGEGLFRRLVEGYDMISILDRNLENRVEFIYNRIGPCPLA